MHSIRTKITAMTVATILVSVLLIGLTSIMAIKKEGDRNSFEMMSLLCDNRRRSIDDYLTSIEKSVSMVSRYAIDELDGIQLAAGGVIGSSGMSGVPAVGEKDPEQQAALDEYLAVYTEKVETLCRSVANHTNGVIAFYYRINPEISQASSGFLYSSVDSAAFRRVPLTDLGRFDPSDVEHTGWYHIPLQRGYPSWLSPYFNQNLDIRMVSYVTPLYKAGTFIGVIGMDISYDTLVDQIRDIRIYDTGYAFLMDADGSIVYHPTAEDGTDLIDLSPVLRQHYDQIGREKSSIEPIRYQMDEQWRQMCFSTLSNGMKLVVTAPVAEINATWQGLTSRIVAGAAALMIVFVLLTFYTVKHMTEPLKTLTEASQDIARGNYDVRLDYNGRDEIGILTDTFRHLVEHLQVYIGDLNSKAYQDSLTGTRNKAAYAMSEQKLSDEIAAARDRAEVPRFALIMMDCNNLKQINDTYGHEKGDIYLRTSCALICKVFKHSPVFRVGGDEFVVLLRGESYELRSELLDCFDEFAARANATAAEPWERVDIAKGIAAYDPRLDDSAKSVLRRADRQMYENKKLLKKQRTC